MTRTYAIPRCESSFARSVVKAWIPPADAPNPTIGNGLGASLPSTGFGAGTFLMSTFLIGTDVDSFIFFTDFFDHPNLTVEE
jgi:hypothetical protein